MTGRDTRIDNAKGVLITLVVLGHLVWPVPSGDRGADALYIAIYFFHMPMFALISGYLSRAVGGWEPVIKGAKLLLAPYVLFFGIHWVLQTAVGVAPYPVYEGHYGLWFLLSLFCWRVLLPHVVRLPHVLLVTIGVAVGVGFIPFVGLELSLSRTIVLLPFFLAGHLMRERGTSPVAVLSGPIAGVVIALALLAAFFLARWNIQPMLYGNNSYAGLGPAIPVGLVGRVVMYGVAFGSGLAALALVPRARSMLTRIGNHSLHVYLLHSALLIPYRAIPAAHDVIGSTPWLLVPAAVFLAWLLSTPIVVRASLGLVSPFSWFRRHRQ